MSGRRGPNWRLLKRIIPAIGMMTGILQRSSLLPSTRQAMQAAGLLCLALSQVYDNFAVFVSD
jgi:hypothetical protein